MLQFRFLVSLFRISESILFQQKNTFDFCIQLLKALKLASLAIFVISSLLVSDSRKLSVVSSVTRLRLYCWEMRLC